jgi:hypothetical protein
MKRTGKAILLCSLGVLFGVDAALADHIGIYADPGGSSCITGALAPLPLWNTSYVIHKYATGATGSRFKVDDLSGLYQGDPITPFPILGRPYTGVSVAYTACLDGSILVYTLAHLWFGQPVTCGKMEIVADPLESVNSAIYADCTFFKRTATGGRFFWNADATCASCGDLAAEPTSWGKVKALYR